MRATEHDQVTAQWSQFERCPGLPAECARPRAGGEHHARALELTAILEQDAADLTAANQQRGDASGGTDLHARRAAPVLERADDGVGVHDAATREEQRIVHVAPVEQWQALLHLRGSPAFVLNIVRVRHMLQRGERPRIAGDEGDPASGQPPSAQAGIEHHARARGQPDRGTAVFERQEDGRVTRGGMHPEQRLGF